MAAIIKAELESATTLAGRRHCYTNTTPVFNIDWQGDITGAYVNASAISDSGTVQLTTSIVNGVSGLLQVTWEVGELAAKDWRINIDLEKNGVVSTLVWTQEVRSSGVGIASAPNIISTPQDILVLVDDNVPSIPASTVFSWTSELIAPITFSVPSGSGVSFNDITGEFEFDSSIEIRQPGSDITLRADNSPKGGQTDVTFNYTVNPKVPVLLGSLADQDYILGDGPQTIDLSSDVSPAGGPAESWSLVAPIPAGVSINGSIVTYDNSSLGANTILYSASNISGTSTSRAFQVTTSTDFTATINPLQSSFAILNTGQNYPLTGAASAGSDGLTVEARVLKASDSTVIATWQDVGVVSGTSWTGTLPIPSTGKDNAVVQARIKFSSASPAQANGVFVGGHVFSVFGQSEYAYWEQSQNNPSGGAAAIPSGLGRVGIMSRGATGINEIDSNSTGLTPAMAGFVASLMKAAPNSTVLVVFHTASGTDPRDWVDDGNASGRDWATDQVTADAVHATGAEMGLVNYSWWHSTTSLGSSWDDVMAPIITGHLMDGTDLRSTITSSGYNHNGQQIDHYLMELYPEAKLVFGDHQEAIPTNGNFLYTDSTDIDTDQQRESARNVANALPSVFANDPWIMPLYHYEVNGGPTEDVTHPDATQRGIVLMAKTAGVSWASALGISSVPKPTLAIESISTSQIVVSSPEGNLTTLRQLNSEAELSPATNWWWGESLGIHVNGKPIGGTTIDNNGNIVCTTPFPIDGDDVIKFGGAGNMGHMQQTQDGFNSAWRSLPGIQVVGQDIEILPIQSPHLFTNTLAQEPRFISPASTPSYWSSSTPVSGASSFYLAFDMECASDNSNYLFNWGNITVRGLSAGRVSVSIRDSADTLLGSLDTPNDVAYSQKGPRRTRFAIGCRLTGAGGDLILHADGHEVASLSLAANTGLLPASTVYLGARSNGGSVNSQRTFENIIFSHSTDDAAYTNANYLADGTAPLGGTVTSLVIEGPAATVNAGYVGWVSSGSNVTDA